jgi:hypothetical protein
MIAILAPLKISLKKNTDLKWNEMKTHHDAWDWSVKKITNPYVKNSITFLTRGGGSL